MLRLAATAIRLHTDVVKNALEKNTGISFEILPVLGRSDGSGGMLSHSLFMLSNSGTDFYSQGAECPSADALGVEVEHDGDIKPPFIGTCIFKQMSRRNRCRFLTFDPGHR